MLFEQDEKKEAQNIAKHDLDFSTAALVFCDENRIERYDYSHCASEDRFITIGRIKNTIVIVVVVYTERGKSIRIISARKANRREEEAYYGGETD